jgi:hypothetical protein
VSETQHHALLTLSGESGAEGSNHTFDELGIDAGSL